MDPIIQVKYEGRTGNQLYQFAMAAVLSRMSGVPFYASPIKGFSGTEGFWPPPFILERTGRMPGRYHSAMDLEKLADIARNEGLIVNGWPHDASYYEPHRAWLAPMMAPEAGPYTGSGEGDILLHLRLGDYFHRGNVGYFGYPLESIYRLLAQLDYARCLIVSDSPDHGSVKKIVGDLRGHLAATPDRMADYRTLYHCRSIIVTPSTFGWWASWSGQATRVYLGRRVEGWRNQSGGDALLPIDGRYVSFDLVSSA